MVLEMLESGVVLDLVIVLVGILVAVSMVLEGIVGVGAVVVLQRLKLCCNCCCIVVVLE